MLVHLPIGALLAGVLLHLISRFRPGSGLATALPWLYGTAAVGGVLAVVSGWLLAGPTGAHWDNHRYWGLGSLAATLLLFGISLRPSGRGLPAFGLALIVVAITSWAGHLGGTLVHGPQHFVQYAPFAPAGITMADPMPVDRDTVRVYAQLIRPILREKCTACHRAGLARGNLRLDSYAALRRGGNEGDAIGSGELWKRVSLPPDHPRFMPSRGPALSYDELTILRSWLDDMEDDSIATVTDWQPDDATIMAIGRRYGIDVRALPYLVRANPPPVNVAAVPDTWRITPLSQGRTTLIAAPGDPASFSPADFAELTPWAGNIVELDLAGVDSLAGALEQLPLMPHLSRLDLSRTDLTDEGLDRLRKYPHLSWLNLSLTRVGDKSVPVLQDLPALEKVYLFESAVTPEALEGLRTARPSLEVVDRYRLADQ